MFDRSYDFYKFVDLGALRSKFLKFDILPITPSLKFESKNSFVHVIMIFCGTSQVST